MTTRSALTNRLALLSLAGLAALTLAACGSEVVDVSGGTSVAPGGTSGGSGSGGSGSGGSGAAGAAIEHPTAADQAIVRVSAGGGFVPRGYDFAQPPEIVIEGDGTVFQPGPQIEIYPAPLLPALTTAPLDEEGVQIVLAAAAEAGLLSPAPSYDVGAGAPQVADAPTTVVEIYADGQTYRHEAYALGFDGAGQESTPARKSLVDFLTELRDLPSLVGDHLGEPELYTPERFGVVAQPATAEELAPTEDQITPAVVPWPASAGDLAVATTCTEVPAAAIGGPFEQANQLTRFSQDGVVYAVFVRVLLPDESCADVP